VGEVQQPRVDEGRQRVLLRPVSRAAGGEDARGGRPRQEDLLPPARHPAGRRSADLRAHRRADAVHRHRHRRHGRYLWFITNKGTSNNNELFVKDLGDPRAPAIDAPVRTLYAGHTAAYDPLGVVNGTLYLRTDREAPNGQIVATPIDRPDPVNWKTIVPESKHAIEAGHLIAGKLAVNAMVDVASEVTFYDLDGKKAGRIDPPGLGTITGPEGRFDRPEVFYSFTSPLHPSTVYRFDVATGASTPFDPPKLTFDPSRYTTERLFATSKDGTRVPMFVTHR